MTSWFGLQTTTRVIYSLIGQGVCIGDGFVRNNIQQYTIITHPTIHSFALLLILHRALGNLKTIPGILQGKVRWGTSWTGCKPITRHTHTYSIILMLQTIKWCQTVYMHVFRLGEETREHIENPKGLRWESNKWARSCNRIVRSVDYLLYSKCHQNEWCWEVSLFPHKKSKEAYF